MTDREKLTACRARLLEMRGRCEAATPGPWEFEQGWEDADHSYGDHYTRETDDGVISRTEEERDNIQLDGAADGEFIAHARTDLPLTVDALTTMLDIIEGQFDGPCAALASAIVDVVALRLGVAK